MPGDGELTFAAVVGADAWEALRALLPGAFAFVADVFALAALAAGLNTGPFASSC